MWARVLDGKTAQFSALTLKDGQDSVVTVIISPGVSVEFG